MTVRSPWGWWYELTHWLPSPTAGWSVDLRIATWLDVYISSAIRSGRLPGGQPPAGVRLQVR